MLYQNKNWEAFVAQLRAKNVDVRFAWEARRDGRKPAWPKYPADVGMVMFSGNGFSPSVLCAVVIDYGKDGYGLFTDEGRLIADDAERIAKPHVIAA